MTIDQLMSMLSSAKEKIGGDKKVIFWSTKNDRNVLSDSSSGELNDYIIDDRYNDEGITDNICDGFGYTIPYLSFEIIEVKHSKAIE